MFKVTERYDLKTLWDILPAEQQQQQQQTHQQEDQQQGQEEEQGQKQEQKERRNTDARKTRKLSIVGREGEQTGSLGLLLCVQIGGKTYLDLFRPKTLEVTPLATWNKDVNVVWASVNPCMSMVAVSYERVTMVEKRQGPVSIRVPERSYDTFVQALRYPGTDKDHHHYQQRQQQQQQHYSSQHVLYHSTQTPQRADFVSEDIKTPFLSTVTLLLTVFNEGITTYTVGIEKRETSSTQSEYIISKPPKKDISICSQFIWSQYTQGTGVLYYITSKQQKGKGKPLHEFHTVPMHTKKPLKNATERVIPALFNMSSYFSLNPVYGTYPLPYTICPIEGEAEENGGFGESTMVTSPLPNVSVVELSPAVVCICVQFEFITHKDGAVSIPVSVIPLTVHARIDFAIPLPGKRGEDFNENTRVSFDACNDFLAVYIPGVYAQLFDFSETHDPFLGLSAETHENATQLGGANAVAPLGDSILLSIKSSVMYMYEISKDFLLEACNTSKNPVVRAKALHAACVHLNDSELASEMLHSALAKGTADVEFIKEVIVGNTFNSLRNSIPYPILLGYPSTALQYTSLVDTLKELKNVESLTLISTESFERERNELQRPYWRPVDPLAIATPLVSLSVQSSGIFQVISPRRSQVQEDDVISYYIRNQYGTIEAITKLMSLNPVFPEHGTAEGRYGLDVERFAAIMREGGSCRASPQPQSSTITLNDSGSSDSEQNEQRDHEENGNNGDNTGSGGYDYYDSELDEWMILDNEGKQSPTVDNHDSKDGRIVSFLKRTATDGESMTKAISAFKEAILALHPRLKQEVAELCAITYVVIQDRVVQTVFRDIIQTLEDSEGLDKQRSRRADARLFHVLENFLSAITEMGRIATPQNFDQMFSQLGYRCLSRQAFLQYAGRGLIKITEDFVTELRKKKVDQKDPEFFYSCLFRLSASCSLRLLLEGPRPPPKFFVEYTFAGGPLRVLASPEVMTLDTDCEHSRFIPLSLFIKSLEKQITFIRKNNPDESDATLCQVMESLSFDNLYEFISPASSCTN